MATKTKELRLQNQELIRGIDQLEKDKVYQEVINTEYRSKVNSVKYQYDEHHLELTTSQSKIDAKLDAVENRIVSLAKQQREMFCLMMLCKGNSLDHDLMLERVNYIERRELRELIEKRFFPNTRAEQSRKAVTQKVKSDQLVEFNINTILLALEKVQEKYNDL